MKTNSWDMQDLPGTNTCWASQNGLFFIIWSTRWSCISDFIACQLLMLDWPVYNCLLLFFCPSFLLGLCCWSFSSRASSCCLVTSGIWHSGCEIEAAFSLSTRGWHPSVPFALFTFSFSNFVLTSINCDHTLTQVMAESQDIPVCKHWQNTH